MKKILTFTVLSASLIALPNAQARSGETHQCGSGKVNLVIINKDLACHSISSEYCLIGPEWTGGSWHPNNLLCRDIPKKLDAGMNASESYKHAPEVAMIQYRVPVPTPTPGRRRLEDRYVFLNYSNKLATTNCSAIFASKANCVITKTKTANNQVTYTLTISKNA